MTNIEKIRQEIERRKGYISVTHFAEELLAFIDSLPEEKPSEDLEEAAENYIAPIENDEGLDYINFNGRDIKDAFIAGAEWQKEQDKDWLNEELIKAHLNGVMTGDMIAREESKMTEESSLTWQDVNKILDISGEMLEDGENPYIGLEEAWAKEVLRRFNGK